MTATNQVLQNASAFFVYAASQAVQLPAIGNKRQEDVSFQDLLAQKNRPAQKDESAPKEEAAASEAPAKKDTAQGAAEDATPTAEQEEAAVAAVVVTAQPILPIHLAGTEEAVEEETVVAMDSLPLADNQEALPQTEIMPEAPEAAEQQPVQTHEAMAQAPVAEDTAPQQDIPVQEVSQEAPQQETHTDTKESHAAVRTVQAEDVKADTGEETVKETPVFDQVEAIPVKVAAPEHTPEPVALETPQAPEEIAHQVAQALFNGESKIELTLTPETLGKLTVEITKDAGGILSVVISASTPKAAAVLQQHTSDLQNILMARDDQVEVHVEVRGSEESQQQFLNPNDANGQNHRQQQQQRQQQEEDNSDPRDFLQKLRLGLVSLHGV